MTSTDPDASETVVTPGGTTIVRSEEFIQLLTPQGERVEDDTFSYAHDDATIAANLRHMVLGRPPPCSARASSASGRPHSAKRPPRSARAPRSGRSMR